MTEKAAYATARELPTPPNGLPPTILLGGDTNAVSIARGLGRMGVKVYALNRPHAYVLRSRYCRGIRTEEPWAEYLLGQDSDWLRGAVVLACSDRALQLMIDHRAELERKYRLDISNVEAQRKMLDKLETALEAQKAGIPTPKFWLVDDGRDIAQHADEFVYPLLVKPRHTYIYAAKAGFKFQVVRSLEELHATYAAMGVPCFLQEMIPMDDDRICSYYTYLDEDGRPLYHYTKRIIRRYPKNRGGACYHGNDWTPELKELGLKFFQSVGLRGVCNVEFVRDDRDGQIKLIECNARFTAGEPMLVASGFALGPFVYNRIVGRPQEPLTTYRTGMTYWYPHEDFKAFRERRRLGELTLWGWIKSLPLRPVLPYWSWRDPLPTLAAETRRVGRFLCRLVGRFRRTTST